MLSPRRLTVLTTFAAGTAFCIVLALMKWSEGERVAAIISSVSALLSVGIAAAFLFPGSESGDGKTARRWRVSRTGRARGGSGSTATTGVTATGPTLPQSVEVSRTGSATVGDDGEAHTGIQVIDTTMAARYTPIPSPVHEQADGNATMEVGRSGRIDSGDHSTNITGAISSLVIATVHTEVPRPQHAKYLVRVRQLRPEELRERDAELVELAEFCTRPDGPAYVWWQAGPWAGKTALMAHFVDHPPSKVRIVSFFIIARDAAEADCEAFLENVIPQLAEIADEPVPPNIAGNHRRNFFWELVEKADVACTRRGERLVLLVDGLDEDQGVTDAGMTRSVASILPKPAGGSFRVIVAGRQNPPIPADVQADHPLRQLATIRLLEPSPYGLAIKEQAELQLRAHLDDDGLQHEVLTFITVARGGLTIPDLAELTGETIPQIRRVLHSHSGRAYQLRDQVWSGAKEAMLAHDKLREAAEESIPREESTAKLTALRKWADRYQALGWPSNSPEYLLEGFHRTLSRAGSAAELVAHVVDLQRLELLRSMTGGDAAGLGQLNAAIDLTVSADADLELVVRLALVRDHLSERSRYLPFGALEVWVRLGDPRRAEALAESWPVTPSQQVSLLSRLVKPLVEYGYNEHVGRVIEKASAVEILVEKRKDLWRDRRNGLAELLANLGFFDESADLLRRTFELSFPDMNKPNIVDHDLFALVSPASHPRKKFEHLLAELENAAERAGFIEKIVVARARRRDPRSSIDLVATAIVESSSIPEASDRSRAFRELASAAVCAGDFGMALDLLDQTVTAARDVSSIWERVHALSEAAGLACDLNAPETTLSIALEARVLADSNTESAAGTWRQILFSALAKNLASAGHFDEAIATAERIEVPHTRQELLAEVAGLLFGAGEAEAADEILQALPQTTDASWARVDAIEHHGVAGRFPAAEAALAAAVLPGARAKGLTMLAGYALSQGDAQRARALILDAERTSRNIKSPATTTKALTALGVAYQRIGNNVQMRNVFNSALHEAQRGVQTNEPGAWGALGLVIASLADALSATDAEVAADAALTSWEQEARLKSGHVSIREVYEFARCIAPIIPALRDRMATLVSVASLERGADASSIASAAVFIKEELWHEAEALPLLDEAVRRIEGPINGSRERAREATNVARALFVFGRIEQARELLSEVLTTARAASDSMRLDLLTDAMIWVGYLGGISGIESIASHASVTDLKVLSPSWARSLGLLGRVDEAHAARCSISHGDRTKFDNAFIDGLREAGFYSEVLTEYYAIDATEHRRELAFDAVSAHLALGDVTAAVQIVTTTPGFYSITLPKLYEACDEYQARQILALNLASGPVELSSFANKFPAAIVANADIIQAIHPVDVERSP